MWFEKLTGFREESPENVRKRLKVDGDTIESLVNNRRFTFGRLDIPTLNELRQNSPPREVYKDRIQVSEIVADVQKLHKSSENRNALFQAASQFNLLEMVGPHITPEQGIDRYENDYTQGPACAIACGAGTIYRNYFVEIENQIGQSKNRQIDCLDLIAKELKNEEYDLWKMQNGYALPNLERNDSNVLYLTLVGGGAFGNEQHWILESLKIAISKFKNVPLDVRMVSFSNSNLAFKDMISEFS